MTSGDRQRSRDGAAKRVQLTSGDHGGPKDKRKKKGKTSVTQPPRQQKKAAVKRQWPALFARLEEVKQREKERQRRGTA